MDKQKTQATPQGKKAELPSPASLRQPLPGTHAEGDVDASDVKQTRERTKEPEAKDFHLKFGEEAHQYVREYIRNADQKAAFFFATATTLLAFLHQRNAASHWLKPIQRWGFVDLTAFISMTGLASGAFIFLIVVFPRLRGSRRGIIFFNAISEHGNEAEYADDVLRRTAGDLGKIKLEHTYALAKICRAKYQVLRLGFIVSTIGAVATLLYLLFA